MASHTTLFDYDPLTGTTELFHWDETAQSFTIETRQDVSDLVEVNKSQCNQLERHSPWGDGQRVASIPLNLWMDLKRRGIGDHEDRKSGFKRLRQWLNDPENRFFRTRPGRL